MGYNDFTTLRQSLADIEGEKLKIDEDLITLQSDVANLKWARDERIPNLERFKSKLQKEKPRLTQNLALENQKLVSANEELPKLQSQAGNYDSSNNVEVIRSELRDLTKRMYVSSEKNKLAFSILVFITVSFIVIFAISYSVFSDLKDEIVYTCPDGFTEVGYYELVDGWEDCPSGWDEKAQTIGGEGGADAFFGLNGMMMLLLVVFVVLFVGSILSSEAIFDHISDKLDMKNQVKTELKIDELNILFAPIRQKSDKLHNKCKDIHSNIAYLKQKIEKMESELDEIIRYEGENVESSRTIEQEIKDLVTQIPQQINDIRNNSTRIEQIFDGVKHLIPNSETVSPNSSNLEEILYAITIEIN